MDSRKGKYSLSSRMNQPEQTISYNDDDVMLRGVKKKPKSSPRADGLPRLRNRTNNAKTIESVTNKYLKVLEGEQINNDSPHITEMPKQDIKFKAWLLENYGVTKPELLVSMDMQKKRKSSKQPSRTGSK